MSHDSTVDAPRGPDEASPSGDLQIRDIQTYFRIFENPDLSRVYYQARDNPKTVPQLREELGLSKSSAYSYVDELTDAGLLVTVDELEGATQYLATDWTLTIELGENRVQMGPFVALVAAHEAQYSPIGRVTEEHGIDVLRECIVRAHAYDRGETTTRQIAANTGLSYGLTLDVLTALADIFGFESSSEPQTNVSTPDDTVVGSGIDLSELGGGIEEVDDADDRTNDTGAIGLVERGEKSDEG